MKTSFSLFLLPVIIGLSSCSSNKKNAEWVISTENEQWMMQEPIVPTSFQEGTTVDATINLQSSQQIIDGFGACFNELGWTSLSLLSKADRETIMKELFQPGNGANFTICRMPIGANDFSRDWYSYNENDKDFAMEAFSVKNDEQTLIPFIKEAQQYYPKLKIWASPWCPPSWMKYNKHYASAYNDNHPVEKFRNGLPADKQGREGTDMFVQDPAYLQAYALYFSKFIDAYKEYGINIFAVMPQNEFNSAQVFPSCCWTSASLANFIGKYLGPTMESKGVELMFGTMERANEALVDTILLDPAAGKYVKGVGFQWAGKGSIPGIHKRYPDLKLYQTEQECGDGQNNWKSALYSWNLMKHYLNSGASAYMYWNISLEEGGVSRWGWAQNSLVVVNPETKAYRFTPEYYIMKHASCYIKPGAKKLTIEGEYTNLVAFQNPDGKIVVVMVNEEPGENSFNLNIAGQVYSAKLPEGGIATLVI